MAASSALSPSTTTFTTPGSNMRLGDEPVWSSAAPVGSLLTTCIHSPFRPRYFCDTHHPAARTPLVASAKSQSHCTTRHAQPTSHLQCNKRHHTRRPSAVQTACRYGGTDQDSRAARTVLHAYCLAHGEITAAWRGRRSCGWQGIRPRQRGPCPKG